MKAEFNIDPDELDNLVVRHLTEGFETLESIDESWFCREDRRSNKRMRKHLKKVIEYYGGEV